MRCVPPQCWPFAQPSVWLRKLICTAQLPAFYSCAGQGGASECMLQQWIVAVAQVLAAKVGAATPPGGQKRCWPLYILSL